MGLHLLFQIPVSGHHESEIRAKGLTAPNPLKFLGLKDPQEPYLNIQAEIPDFVQKEGPSVCQFKPSNPASSGSCKGAFLVAKKLTRDEAFREGTAMNPDESFIRAGTVTVDGPRHQFLANARLTNDHDSGIGSSDLIHLGKHFLNNGTLSHDIFKVKALKMLFLVI